MTQKPLEFGPKLSPQQQHVLELLQLSKGRGIGGVEFVLEHGIFAYAQRVSELRLDHSLDIVARKDGRSKTFRYWLAEYAPKVEAA